MGSLISVIVPVYKVEEYLRQCVDSILKQTYTNLEIILVDDGSPDNCPAICDEYALKDSRVKVIHTENRGVSCARNIGLQYASGDYIAFVDSDDWLEINLYETVMKHTPFDVAVFGVTLDYPDEDKMDVVKVCEKSFLLHMDKDSGLFCRLAEMSLLGYACNKVYTRTALEGNIFPDVRIREDLLFNLSVLKKLSSIQLIDSEGYHYIQHGGSTLHKPYSGAVPDIVSIAEQIGLVHPLLSSKLNQKTVGYILKMYLCDAIYKYIFNNEVLSEAEKINEMRKIFSSRMITTTLKPYPGDNKLYIFLTICAKMRASKLFYKVIRSLWSK